MIDQLLRSRRGLLVVGAALALIAFALVVVLLNQKSTTTSTNPPTAVAGSTTPTTVAQSVPTVIPSPTVSILPGQMIVAAQDIPAGTELLNAAAVQKYLKDTPIVGPLTTEDVMTSTGVLSSQVGVTETVRIPARIKRGTPVSRQLLDIQPLSPPSSLAYQLRPGRVAETVQVSTVAANDLHILPGDYVDIFLTLYRNVDLSSRVANPPDPIHSGPMQTQQLIAGVRVLATTIITGTGGIFTLELTPQDAALVKYVKDTAGQIDLSLVSADDVQTRAASPKTIPIVPEYFLTPQTTVRGTPQDNGVAFPFDTPLPTLTPTVFKP